MTGNGASVAAIPGQVAVSLVDATLAFTAVFAAIVVGVLIYADARTKFGEDAALLIGMAIGGLLLAGSFPSFVALAVAEDTAVQGFPTALRIVPGIVALFVYLYARQRPG